MSNEKGMRVLTSLVALGIFIVAALATYFQSILALPLAIIGIIFVSFILMQKDEKSAHLAENLERLAFIITFLIICIAFICLYKAI
ncbi:hypothetical protein [Methanobrevibacter olleyae]|uniref:Energy-converting hydrogenase A subunit K n=1 Tax=Methanobrevibacter olleyae TaxID=294671 RepID=A0A126R067_METOL|nr:hypothetical protein [Methanobrevibacter olleyae]AMK15457.1 energy-converting hydrogenase A subunit K EhaK [Methanobrevibacter olleyae]SFL56776.1 energy-converting hydrogenase A subunit K [Methanobrevibacter olleyae]